MLWEFVFDFVVGDLLELGFVFVVVNLDVVDEGVMYVVGKD